MYLLINIISHSLDRKSIINLYTLYIKNVLLPLRAEKVKGKKHC